MKTVLSVFGTRPEAIKMCPLVNELRGRSDIRSTVCVTGQHRQMLDEVLTAFGVSPDFDLSIMKEGQTLSHVTESILDKFSEVLDKVKPDIVLVHGDTTSAFAAAMTAFYKRIDVGHVEAGLRTYNIDSPYPEEFNRQAIGIIAKYHFAPTEWARDNLIREGKSSDYIFVTGNTVIDAMRTTVRSDYTHPELEWAKNSSLVIVTAHRRENLGTPMREIFRAIRKVVEEKENVKVIFPVHMNPAIREAVYSELLGNDRIHLIEPLDVISFHNFLAHAHLVLTDSGGIQEEATYLGIPVLVMRNTTERPEGLSDGTLKLIGTSEEAVYENFMLALKNNNSRTSDTACHHRYGDGFASKRIADILTNRLK